MATGNLSAESQSAESFVSLLRPTALTAVEQLAARRRAAPPPVPVPPTLPDVNRQPAVGALPSGDAVEPVAPPVAGEDSVPPLEPPRPLAARVSGFPTWRERLGLVPSWLTSMAIHVLVLVMLATLALPLGDRNSPLPIILTFGAETREESDKAQPVVILQDLRQQDEDNRERGEITSAESGEDEDDADGQEEPQATDGRDENEEQEVESAPDPEPIRDAVEPAAAQPSNLLAVAPDATRPAGHRPVRIGPAEQIIKSTPPRFNRNLRTLETVAQRRRLDHIVEDFIQYDIGKLRGREGLQALKKFDQLGPESIPALVRGLNRSACLRQSCPVCVIYRKLDEQLSDCDDPAMIYYAVENLGRDLPKNAPYAKRVRSLHDKWAQIFFSREDALKDVLASRGIEPSDELIDQLHSLTDAESFALLEAMSSPNEHRRLAAVLVVNGKFPDYHEGVKVMAGRQLITLLSDPDQSVANAAHGTLVSVTGNNLCSHEGGSDWDVQQARAAWTAYWETYAQNNLLEPRAKSLLAMGENLAAHGRSSEAAERYRKIVREYPSTDAAAVARKRLAASFD